MQKQWLLPIGVTIAVPSTTAFALHLPIIVQHPDTTLIAAGVPITVLGLVSFAACSIWALTDEDDIQQARKKQDPNFKFHHWTKILRQIQTRIMLTSIPLTIGVTLLSARVFYEG